MDLNLTFRLSYISSACSVFDSVIYQVPVYTAGARYITDIRYLISSLDIFAGSKGRGGNSLLQNLNFFPRPDFGHRWGRSATWWYIVELHASPERFTG